MATENLPLRTISIDSADFEELQQNAWGESSNQQSWSWTDKPFKRNLDCVAAIRGITLKNPMKSE